jgi:hypothetical protein
MRSPFTPTGLGGPSQLLPADVATMWALAMGAAPALAAGSGAIPPEQLPIFGAVLQALSGLTPGNEDLGRMILEASPGAAPVALADAISQGVVSDVPSSLESNASTFEIGYQGVVGGRVRLAADLWYSQRRNFTSPLVVRTPFLLLSGVDVGAYIQVPTFQALVGYFVEQGLPQPQAEAQAAAIAPEVVTRIATTIGSIPVGVVSSEDIDASAADVIVTYINVGDINFMGADLAFEAVLDEAEQLTLSGSLSWVEKDQFTIPELTDPITLNAPKFKGSLALALRRDGYNLEGRFRHIAEFPANSAGFVGIVEAGNLFDVNAGIQIPGTRATAQLTVNDVLNSGYRSFVGLPTIGRFAMLGFKYDLN